MFGDNYGHNYEGLTFLSFILNKIWASFYNKISLLFIISSFDKIFDFFFDQNFLFSPTFDFDIWKIFLKIMELCYKSKLWLKIQAKTASLHRKCTNLKTLCKNLPKLKISSKFAARTKQYNYKISLKKLDFKIFSWPYLYSEIGFMLKNYFRYSKDHILYHKLRLYLIITIIPFR